MAQIRVLLGGFSELIAVAEGGLGPTTAEERRDVRESRTDRRTDGFSAAISGVKEIIVHNNNLD